MCPRVFFAKNWESHHTKEYSLVKNIGVLGPKLGVLDCKSAISESSDDCGSDVFHDLHQG